MEIKTPERFLSGSYTHKEELVVIEENGIHTARLNRMNQYMKLLMRGEQSKKSKKGAESLRRTPGAFRGPYNRRNTGRKGRGWGC